MNDNEKALNEIAPWVRAWWDRTPEIPPPPPELER